MSFDEDYGYLFDDEYATQFTPTVDFAQNYAKSLAVDRGLPPENFVRQIGIESGWNPNAKGAAGEVGYGQFMPQTAKNLGVDRDTPIKNLTGAADFMSDLTTKYDGDYGKAAMAYNAGEGAVDSGRIPDMSKNYAAKVLGSEVPQAPSFAAAKSRAALPDPTGRLQDLAALDEETASLEALKREALGQMGQGTNLSGQNTLAVALTALLPALIGLGMHGKEGLAQGFNAGAAGAGVGLQGFANEAKEQDMANQLLYKDAATQLAAKQGEAKAVRDSIRDREEKNVELEFLEQGKGARANKIANAMGKSAESPLEGPDKVKIQEYRAAIQSGVSALDAINNKFANKLDQRYLTPEGELDWSGIKKSGGALLEGALGAGTETDRFNSEIRSYISQLVKETSGTAASDKEREYLSGILTGTGILPADVPTIYENIARLVEKQRIQAEGYLDTALAARGANPREAILDLLPKSPKPKTSSSLQTSTIPQGARSITFADGSKGYYLNNKPYTLDGTEVTQ
jgi:hypothetical protein